MTAWPTYDDRAGSRHHHHREDRAAPNPARLEAADVLAAVEIISAGTGTTDRDGNYETVARDLDGTVTLLSPVSITLSLEALITR